MTPKRFGWILLTTVLAMALNVAVAILWVAVYAYFINPGHDNAFYEAYAKLASPYSSILAGMPIFFVFCRWLGRRWEAEFAVRAALYAWLMYAVLDLAILIPSGMTGRLALLAGISQATKLGAAYLGGRSVQFGGRVVKASE